MAEIEDIPISGKKEAPAEQVGASSGVRSPSLSGESKSTKNDEAIVSRLQPDDQVEDIQKSGTSKREAQDEQVGAISGIRSPSSSGESKSTKNEEAIGSRLQPDDQNADDNGKAAVRSSEEGLLDVFQMHIEPIPTISLSQHGSSVPGAYAIVGPDAQREGMHWGSGSQLGQHSHIDLESPAPANLVFEAIIAPEEGYQMETAVSTHERSPPSSHVDGEVFDGKILPETNEIQGKWRHVAKWVCVISLPSFAIAAIILATSLQGSVAPTDSPPPSKQSGTASLRPGNMTMYPPFQDTLPTFILKEIADTVSPFHSANKWMLDDPHLNSYSMERQRQRFYLAMVYNATNGDHWIHKDHWMSYNTSECQWYSRSSLPEDSVYYIPNVCNKNESLISLSLAHNNLTGRLPLFPTAMLPHLRAIDVDDNGISGAFPPILSSPFLDVVIISKNDFSGSMKAGDGLFDFIFKVVKTNGNSFTTGVPNNEGAMIIKLQHTVEVWNSTDNQFAGQLPTEIGLATNLFYIGRGDNEMIGTLPSELGLLTNLQGLDYGGNAGVNGTIPAELAALTLLTHLDLAGTSITGSIPALLCRRVEQGTLEMKVNCSLVGCCE
jgi:hypothetical protein